MGNDDHGALLLSQRANGAEHLAHQLGIERRRRLVKQDDLRTHRQRASDSNALLLAAGEPTRETALSALQPHFLQQRTRTRFGFPFRFAFDDHRSFNNVFQHRAVGKQIEVLEHETDLLA